MLSNTKCISSLVINEMIHNIIRHVCEIFLNTIDFNGWFIFGHFISFKGYTFDVTELFSTEKR